MESAFFDRYGLYVLVAAFVVVFAAAAYFRGKRKHVVWTPEKQDK